MDSGSRPFGLGRNDHYFLHVLRRAATALRLCVLLGVLGGCAFVDIVDPRYDSINRSTAKARNESILLNVVRASHNAPLNFVAFSKVSGQTIVTANMGERCFSHMVDIAIASGLTVETRTEITGRAGSAGGGGAGAKGGDKSGGKSGSKGAGGGADAGKTASGSAAFCACTGRTRFWSEAACTRPRTAASGA